MEPKKNKESTKCDEYSSFFLFHLTAWRRTIAYQLHFMRRTYSLLIIYINLTILFSYWIKWERGAFVRQLIWDPNSIFYLILYSISACQIHLLLGDFVVAMQLSCDFKYAWANQQEHVSKRLLDWISCQVTVSIKYWAYLVILDPLIYVRSLIINQPINFTFLFIMKCIRQSIWRKVSKIKSTVFHGSPSLVHLCTKKLWLSSPASTVSIWWFTSIIWSNGWYRIHRHLIFLKRLLMHRVHVWVWNRERCRAAFAFGLFKGTLVCWLWRLWVYYRIDKARNPTEITQQSKK